MSGSRSLICVNLYLFFIKPNCTAEPGEVNFPGHFSYMLFIHSTVICPSFKANDLSNGLGTPPVAMLPTNISNIKQYKRYKNEFVYSKKQIQIIMLTKKTPVKLSQ